MPVGHRRFGTSNSFKRMAAGTVAKLRGRGTLVILILTRGRAMGKVSWRTFLEDGMCKYRGQILI